METAAWKLYDTALRIPLDVTIDIPPDVRMPASPQCAPLSAASSDSFAAGPSAPLAIPTKLPSLATRIPDRKAIEMSDANSVDGGRVRNTEIGETQGVDMAEVRLHPPLPASGAMWLSVPRCFGWRVETRQQREMMTAADSVSVLPMRLRDHPARRTDGCGFDERDASDLLCFASVRCSSL